MLLNLDRLFEKWGTQPLAVMLDGLPEVPKGKAPGPPTVCGQSAERRIASSQPTLATTAILKPLRRFADITPPLAKLEIEKGKTSSG